MSNFYCHPGKAGDSLIESKRIAGIGVLANVMGRASVPECGAMVKECIEKIPLTPLLSNLCKELL
jgi:hypothetical protein